ncbi:uncharacterized protein METZ01_LOCUS12229 [marine metagenome]|uniref:DUF1015 domain-containing protein n=1 Tax=marine metagenome TaxID=408172 RepID=A0A381NXM8_9ZZZZ
MNSKNRNLIKPFKALRPIPEKVNDVIAPPYDVLNSTEARKMVKNRPYSFLHISKPEIDLPENTKLNDPKVYKKGRENLSHLIDKKILIKDEDDALYIYEIIFNNKSQTGIACVASIAAYDSNFIKKHEYTTLAKEDDRARNIDELKTQTGPVLLTYKNNNEIKEKLQELKSNKPLYEVNAIDSSVHKIWKIGRKEEIDILVNKLNSLKKMFIADGHHRSAAASRVSKNILDKNPNHNGLEPYNFFLAVAFPDSEMTILDYNRVIHGKNGNTTENLLHLIKDFFEVEVSEKPYKPLKQGEFGMYLDKTWYRLQVNTNLIKEEDPVKSLDVSLLHEYLISNILGITEVRTDKRIEFVGGARGLSELETLTDKGENSLAFSLFPTPIEALINVAESNKIMPPKSTWFEPKLLDGLLSFQLSD